jgi:hypothetical protein
MCRQRHNAIREPRKVLEYGSRLLRCTEETDIAADNGRLILNRKPTVDMSGKLYVVLLHPSFVNILRVLTGVSISV